MRLTDYLVCDIISYFGDYMTMHIAHPSLSKIGKKAGKKKWASAEQKRQAEEAERNWNQKQKEWAKMSPMYGKKFSAEKPVTINNPVPESRDPKNYGQSLGSWITGAVNTGQKQQEYTGTEMIGITVIHKSGLQPVFSKEAAVDAAHMRR